MSAIGLGKRTLVGLGGSGVLRLETRRLRVWLLLRRLLCRRGRVLDSARAAVERCVIGVLDDAFVHDRLIHIGCVNDVHIHLRDRGVIGKTSASPLAAGKAYAPETEAVVHAAVVAHGLAPVAAMKAIPPVVPAPVGRRPQRAAIGSRNPGAGHEIVVAFVRGISPVTRSPHQVRLGAHRLNIDRKHRRSESDIDAHAELRVHGWDCYRYQHSKQKQTNRADQAHTKNLLVLSSRFYQRIRSTLGRAMAWETTQPD